MLDKMKQLYQLQKKAREVQKELKETEIEARSTDGAVTIVFNGEQHITEVSVDANVLKPENRRQLEETLKKTIAEAISRAQALAAEKTKSVMKDLGVNIPGL
jgi:DNA-binding YbaB/EbfC family protein